MQASAKDSAAGASGSNAIPAQPPHSKPSQKHEDDSGPAPSKQRERSDKGKHKATPQNEIDALFDATLGKKVKRAELANASADKGQAEDTETDLQKGEEAKRKHKSKTKEQDGDSSKKKSKKRKEREEAAADKDLDDVLGAIRSAPKEDKGPKKRKRVH